MMIDLRHTAASKLSDAKGASMVIALIFFLICAVVGSTVLTAASINAQAAATYKKVRQAEYTVGSASAMMGSLLQENVRVAWVWSPAAGDKPTFDSTYSTGSGLALSIWSAASSSIWHQDPVSGTWVTADTSASDYTINVDKFSEVTANVDIDKDLNITIKLSIPDAANPKVTYHEKVYLQARPEYMGNKLIAVTWESPIITKIGSAS